MKHLICLFISINAVIFSFGQNPSIDSLQQVLLSYTQLTKKTFSDDTIAVNNYLAISAHYTAVKNDSSLIFSNAALELSQKIRWKEGEAKAECAIGLYSYKVTRDYDLGILHFEKSNALWAQITTSEQPIAAQRLWLARCYQEAFKPEAAIPLLIAAVEFYSKINNVAYQIISLGTLGVSYQRLNQDSLALQAYLQGLELARSINEEVNMAVLYGNIGDSYFALGQLAEAIKYYELTAELSRKLNNIRGEVRGKIGVARVKTEIGEFEEAVDLLNDCIVFCKQENYNQGLLLVYNQISQSLIFLGSYEQVIKINEDLLILAYEMNDLYAASNGFINIGIAHQYLGNYALALEYQLKSLKVNSEIPGYHASDNYVVWGNISNTYYEIGNYEKALEYQLMILAAFSSFNSRSNEALTLGNIGNTYSAMGNYELANEFQNNAYTISRELGMTSVVISSLINLGANEEKMQDYASALEYFTSALQIAQSINSTPNLANCHTNISKTHVNLKNYDLAIEHATLGYSYAVQVENQTYMRNALSALYIAHLYSGNAVEGFQYLSRYKDIIFSGLETNFFGLSEMEREAYYLSVEDDLDPYYDYGLHFNSIYPALTDTLYNMAVTTKGLSLKSSTLLRQSILSSDDSSLIVDYNYLVDLRKKLSNTNSTTAEAKALFEEANELEKSIVERSGAFSDFEKIKQLDWKEVRESLNPNECAIEFVNFQSTIDTSARVIYAALLVKPESEHPQMIQLCYESDLITILGKAQVNNIGYVNAIYGKRDKAQAELYQKLWQPLEPYLEGVKRVYYSPSGLLHKVSFGAICKQQNIFLSDLYKFRQMSSTGNLVFESNTELTELENFMLMGGVTYNSDTTERRIWDYLPSSLEETDVIYDFLEKKKFGVNYFNGTNATEEIFKEKIGSSSIVHIATHGFFFPDPAQVREELKVQSEAENVNEELNFRGTTNYADWSFVNNKNPLMRSGIVLANANDVWSRDPLAEGEDGILTAQEVSNLDLRSTKLVVLSACETGLGDIKGSEGVFGLQRAFKMAGVKYLIMSLWQVPDKETSEFMILFYKNLIKVKDIPTAFQKTQKVMREKYDPYYWGAFVLIE